MEDAQEKHAEQKLHEARVLQLRREAARHKLRLSPQRQRKQAEGELLEIALRSLLLACIHMGLLSS